MTTQRWFAISLDGEKREIRVMGPYYGLKEHAHQDVVKKRSLSALS